MLWDLGGKNNCLQKATVQSPWTTHGMATARNVGTAGWIVSMNLHIAWRHTTLYAWFTPSLVHSHTVTSYRFFWGGAYRFTWFGALSQHNRTLPYWSSLRLSWPHLIWIPCGYTGTAPTSMPKGAESCRAREAALTAWISEYLQWQYVKQWRWQLRLLMTYIDTFNVVD